MEQEQRIEALRNNRIVFGKMDSDIRLEAKRIGHRNFLCYIGDDKWDDAQGFESWRTYKLKSDYQEQPAIIEEKVFVEDNMLRYTHDEDHHSALMWAPSRPDFIGFKYEDGSSHAVPRLFRDRINNKTYEGLDQEDNIDAYEVLIPTHVLFSK